MIFGSAKRIRNSSKLNMWWLVIGPGLIHLFGLPNNHQLPRVLQPCSTTLLGKVTPFTNHRGDWMGSSSSSFPRSYLFTFQKLELEDLSSCDFHMRSRSGKFQLPCSFSGPMFSGGPWGANLTPQAPCLRADWRLPQRSGTEGNLAAASNPPFRCYLVGGNMRKSNKIPWIFQFPLDWLARPAIEQIPRGFYWKTGVTGVILHQEPNNPPTPPFAKAGAAPGTTAGVELFLPSFPRSNHIA